MQGLIGLWRNSEDEKGASSPFHQARLDASNLGLTASQIQGNGKRNPGPGISWRLCLTTSQRSTGYMLGPASHSGANTTRPGYMLAPVPVIELSKSEKRQKKSGPGYILASVPDDESEDRLYARSCVTEWHRKVERIWQ